MKKLIAAVVLASAVTLATGSTARAEEKMLAVVTKIDLSKDGGSAVATMKDAKSGKTLDVLVQDKLTLDKFKDHRITPGDEIKLKFEPKDGKNLSTYFRRAAGC
jgi:hypothetical protein